MSKTDDINSLSISKVDLSCGNVLIKADIDNAHFYSVLSEKCGITITNDRELMSEIHKLAVIKSRYMRISDALEQVEATGYGIVMPSVDELSLE